MFSGVIDQLRNKSETAAFIRIVPRVMSDGYRRMMNHVLPAMHNKLMIQILLYLTFLAAN